MVGEAIFARITDLKYVEKIGMSVLKCFNECSQFSICALR